MAHNIRTNIEGRTLTVTIDLDHETYPSSTGESHIIASTQGNAKLAGLPASYRLSLNLYQKLDRPAAAGSKGVLG